MYSVMILAFLTRLGKIYKSLTPKAIRSRVLETTRLTHRFAGKLSPEWTSHNGLQKAIPVTRTASTVKRSASAIRSQDRLDP